MFNKNSPLVKTWVRLLSSQNPVYTFEDVPDIGNLREIVSEAMENTKNEK